MTDKEYLESILASQDLSDDSTELEEIQEHRKNVEKILRDKFSASSPTVRYGGSKAKGTLIRESYDLDVICYFPHDDTGAGETLKDIYNNVRNALAEKYNVDPKTSALRLRSKDKDRFGQDLRIDVVPGRYTDDSKTDCFIHQQSAEKERLKTNLQVHIDHVKQSGVVDALRLLKLWKVRKAVRVKQFAFELLGIEVLAKKKSSSLDAQVKHVWEEIAEAEEPISTQDPANLEGNDLMPLLRGAWQELQSVAASTLKTLEDSGWEGVFGSVEGKSDKVTRISGLTAAAAAVSRPTKPYGSDDE